MEKIELVAAANDLYVPYLSVMIESVMDYSSKDKKYNFTILHTDITEKHQKILTDMMNRNFSIDFIDVTSKMTNYTELFISNHIKIETYFRLLLPELMPNTPKVLYIDCDVIANSDVAELFNVDVTDYFLAGTRDADSAANYNNHIEDKEYIDEVLKLTKPYDYIQAGIIVMNLDKFRKECNTKRLLDVALSRQWKFHDQDTLNYLCKGEILFVDYAWNFVYDYNESIRRSIVYLPNSPAYVMADYLRAKRKPKMIHFSWTDKPWFSPGVHFGEKWWMIARKTPFYTAIIMRTEDALAQYIMNT